MHSNGSDHPSDLENGPENGPENGAENGAENGSENDSEKEPSPGATTTGQDSLLLAGPGSGLLAQQPTPDADEAVAVARVCPQCGAEYETGDRFCPKDGTPLRPKSGGDPLVGRVIAERYLILARLGEGGMGRVYLAEHVKMNRQCAIKVMSPALIHDTESLQRFAREASSAARILHPNVAAVFDYGEADKIVYLVMEFVDGESLSTILARDRALDPRRAIDLARQIADGLHAAHELGIVHRDLKPDNIIVTRNKGGKEIPKVVDFGIAKALTDAKEDALTRSGLVIGTPEYMAPEQLLGDPVDARADIYSLGCILYQMLTGEAAFAAESREQMIRRRLHEQPPHVRDLLPDLPRRVDTLIVHMLARSPGDRLASAAEARDQLDPALALGGWDPGSISAPGPIATQSPYRDDPSMRPTIPMPKVTTSPKRIAIGSVVGSALLLGGMYGWMKVADKRERDQEQAAQVAAQQARKKTADSLALAVPHAAPQQSLPALAKPDSAVKPKPVSTAAFDAPLARLAAAVQSGDIAKVGAAFPGMPQGQKDFYETLFKKADKQIGTSSYKVDASFGDVTPVGSHATRDYTLTIHYRDPNSLAPMTTTARYRAAYEQKDGKWTLVGLSVRER